MPSSGLSMADGDVVVCAQKIVSKSEGRLVRLSDVTPTEGPPGTSVTITGVALGGKDESTRIRLDDVSLPAPADRTDWDDDHVVFTVPDQHPKGVPWTPPQVVTIRVVSNGHTSANALRRCLFFMMFLLWPPILSVGRRGRTVRRESVFRSLGSGLATAA